MTTFLQLEASKNTKSTILTHFFEFQTLDEKKETCYNNHGGEML